VNEPRKPSSARTCAVFAAVLVSTALTAALAAAEIPESSYSDLHWRLVGPFRSGWATAVAGHPVEPAVFYFGGADGGVWKTDDAGQTWRPLFDRQGSASIGALTIAAADPSVIWVGTGQIQQRWDIVDGDGVYRSTDGGKSWVHLGLAETKHIGALWVDPTSADVAVVAALGHVFGPNEERGLFRTEDGGRTWTRVLYLDPDTGAADIAGTPELPDVLFASLWQVRRHPWLDYFQPTVGPGSGIYKSVDGGRGWVEVAGSGLPKGPLGRIELAVAPNTGARRVWATIEATEGGGLYRSEDGGAAWELINDDKTLAGSYMSWLVPDPRDPETVWTGGRPLRRSRDGGRSFTIVRSSPGGDDYHALWIDPRDPRRMITGADQGAVVTWNGGESWSSWYNQPTGQFYRLAVDDRFPYRIYSGQQDCGSVGIASRSDYGQLTFRDWSPVGGDERDGDVPDPTNPDVVYGAGLGGRLSKWNARTGQVQNVAPWPVGSYAERPGTTRYRYDWITPLAISKRPPHAIYLGAQVLFRSLDGGATWATISPDLSGAVPGARGCEGEVPLERATACGYGTIFAISPSPSADGLVWVGTTNGRVQLTRDGGATWTDVTPPGMRDWTKVNLIDASATDPATAYVAADRHRADDYDPIAYRTHDFGATWTEIGHGLPRGAWVGVVREDPEQPGLLYAGTSRGVWVSFDDGKSWRTLQLDLPTTGINDLLVHDGDIIVATQGRAIWVLDEVAPLRHLAASPVAGQPVLVPPATAWRLRFDQNRDTPLPPEEPRGENPPVGAVLDYILPEGAKGEVAIEVLDAGGAVVRRFASDDSPKPPNAPIYFADIWLGKPPLPGTGAGHHRFVWDLRYPPPPTLESSYSIAAVPGRPTPALPEGAFVLPGRYEIRLTVGGRSVVQPLTVAMDPRVTASPADLAALLGFQKDVSAALGRVVRLSKAIDDTAGSIAGLLSDPAVRASKSRLTRAAEELSVVRGSGEEGLAWAAEALSGLATDLESVDASPTASQREVLAMATERVARAETRWTAFDEGALRDLRRRLQRAGLSLEPTAPP
jgi:photosystem II stability/assembly factor-like uncharacterized protein